MKEGNNIKELKKEACNYLFNDELFNNENQQNYKNEKMDKIIDEIDYTTLDENIKRTKKIENISFNTKTKQYIYNVSGKEIYFRRISDYIKDEYIKKVLLSPVRFKKCHLMSFGLIECFQRASKIITGIAIRHGRKYLHSIIEIESKGKKYIIDSTMNILMEKEQYIKLLNFEEIETIINTELKEDIKNGTIDILNKIRISIKAYLTFRKEIIRDLEKNRFILEKMNEKQQLNENQENNDFERR